MNRFDPMKIPEGRLLIEELLKRASSLSNTPTSSLSGTLKGPGSGPTDPPAGGFSTTTVYPGGADPLAPDPAARGRLAEADRQRIDALRRLNAARAEVPPTPVDAAYRTRDLLPLGIAGLFSALAGNQGGQLLGNFARGYAGGKDQGAARNSLEAQQAYQSRQQAAQDAFALDNLRADAPDWGEHMTNLANQRDGFEGSGVLAQVKAGSGFWDAMLGAGYPGGRQAAARRFGIDDQELLDALASASVEELEERRDGARVRERANDPRFGTRKTGF